MKKRFLIFLLIIAPLCINAVHASEDNAKLQLLKEKHYETEGTIVTVKIPHVVNVKDDKVKETKKTTAKKAPAKKTTTKKMRK